MALRTKRITEMEDMHVYTDEGTFFGIVEEAQILGNKVYGWRIKSGKNSYLSRVLGGAKGVIVPHQFVKSIDNIMIVSKSAVPAIEPEKEDLMEEE